MRQAASIALLLFNLGLTKAQVIDSIQSDKSHTFSFYTGFSKLIEKDDAMSPFKYRGNAIPIEISYKYFSTKSRHEFYVSFDNLRLRSSLPDYRNAGLNHYVKSTNIQVGYSYSGRVFTIDRYKSDLYLGGEVNSVLNLRQQVYIYSNEFLMLDQFNNLGLKVQLDKRFADNKQVAFVRLNIPIVSYVLMGNIYNAYVGKKIDPLMNYSGNILLYLATKGDFVSFNKLVYFKADFSFVQFMGSHIGIECKCFIRYYKFTQYQDINYSKNLQNQFLIGLVGKL